MQTKPITRENVLEATALVTDAVSAWSPVQQQEDDQ